MEQSQPGGRNPFRRLFLGQGSWLLGSGAGHWKERIDSRTVWGMAFLGLVTNLMCVKLIGREEVRKMIEKCPFLAW